MTKQFGTDVQSPGALAWELFYEVFRASKPYLETIAGRFDLTPQQMYALRNLASGPPLPMSALASTMGCDASNVTALVDRLETRGLVERRSSDLDRRVKVLVMTAAGRTLHDGIMACMQDPPPAIGALSLADQRALSEILARALANVGVAVP